MSALPRRLQTRLFLSYVVVVASGAIAMFVVGTVVTRTVYRRELGGYGFGRGNRHGDVDEAALTHTLDQSLIPALLVGAGVALVVGAAVAWAMSRRLLRPLDDVRSATRRIAAGDYAVRVASPPERELASLAGDVNVLASHLADVEQRRSQLLSEVTHEMRTPITVIGGHLEGMIDGVIDPSDASLVLLADETKRLERLVDDLTLLSRADEGTLGVRRDPVDLASVVDAVARRLAPQFEHADVALVNEVAGALPVMGDEQRLAQVLTNVVGNALEHTPAGGRVRITGGLGADVWVDVTDTGEGLAADQLDAVFERFYRAPSASRRAGRGIGLTIARSLMRAHGGDLTASSRGPHLGATFHLRLPRG